MTRQNKIHKYIREFHQYRKMVFRHNSRFLTDMPHHNRKWWKVWHMYEMGYEKGREDAIDECIAILIDDSCAKTCPYEIPNCTKCMKKRLEALKEKKDGNETS